MVEAVKLQEKINLKLLCLQNLQASDDPEKYELYVGKELISLFVAFQIKLDMHN